MRTAQRCIVAALLAAPAFAQPVDPQEFFENRVRPLLVSQCFACHADSNLGELRLDSREEVFAGGKRGPAIVPGEPGESLLIRAVRHEDSAIKMPMGGRLSDEQIEDLAAWVKLGAPWPKNAAKAAPPDDGFIITPEERSFWAFQPIEKPVPPKVNDAAWPRSAIDRFVLAKLEQNNLRPVKAADRRSLIRRASLDLTGLPPMSGEVDAFLADASPDAFAKVVDRLLASPHYGERWGRHWLDVARYADGDGDGERRGDAYANTWRYPDWVIASLNRDLPYDQFVKAQIAGDLLDPDDRERLVPGLGLFGLGPWGAGTQVSFQEDRAAERDDRIDVVSRGFLGLTVACARCHDPKYDPISQQDYYALGGIFANTEYKEYLLSNEEDITRFIEHQAKVRKIEAQIRGFLRDQEKMLREILARRTEHYMMAAWAIQRAGAPESDVAKVAAEQSSKRPSNRGKSLSGCRPRRLRHSTSAKRARQRSSVTVPAISRAAA
jgi:mono/diheme cytochrome c family protein